MSATTASSSATPSFFICKERLTGLRRNLAAGVARRCGPLSGLQATVAGADVERHACVAERGAADRGRRGALHRRRRDRGRMPRLRGSARSSSAGVRRSVHERSVARHARCGDPEPALRHAKRDIFRRSAKRCGSNTKPSSARASCCRSTRPTSRSSGTSRSRTSRCPTSSPSSRVSLPRSTRRLRTSRPTASGSTSAGATRKSPHDADVPLDDILPALRQANVGALYSPFAGPRHAHEFRCFEKLPLKRRSGSDRRRDRSPDQCHRASRGRRRPDRARRRRGRRSDARCWPPTIAAFDTWPVGAASRRTWSGPSSEASAKARGSRRAGCSDLPLRRHRQRYW